MSEIEEITRKIIHIDMDAFFASVEQRDNPDLRGKPVVVGGRPGKRGVVAAASYEARKFGIRSAMPSTQVQQRCPHTIFVRPRFDVYRKVSQQIRSIFRDYTDLVEPLSLDEAFLDVTQNKKENPSATWIANEIRAQIWRETRLTSSAGVACNKFLAKIASDINKPNGIFVIHPKNSEAFVASLPIGKFFGIGAVTEKKMHRLKIFNGADLREHSEAELIRHFGKSGSFYFRIARGVDHRKVEPNRISKSVGVEETLTHDLEKLEDIEAMLKELAEALHRRLAKADVSGKTVTLKLRYPNFETLTRAYTGDLYIKDAHNIFQIAKRLLMGIDLTNKKIRLLGITLSKLDNQKDESHQFQIPLPFGDDFENF